MRQEDLQRLALRGYVSLIRDGKRIIKLQRIKNGRILTHIADKEKPIKREKTRKIS